MWTMNRDASRARPQLGHASSRGATSLGTALRAALVAGASLLPAHAQHVNPSVEEATRGDSDTGASLPVRDAGSVEQAAPDSLAEAVDAARSVTGAGRRASALNSIAQAQAQAGDSAGAARSFTEAVAAARSIAGAGGRAWALGGIAGAQARSGNPSGAARSFTEALAAARSIEDAYNRVAALRNIARAQVAAANHPQ